MSSATIGIEVTSAHQAFLLKDELLAAGLQWEVDFTWRYDPRNTDEDYYNNIKPYVEFTFEDEKLATYYRMKWT